ncbi:MAG: TIGR04086 family membrane protein [Oscillospiraceae bacterium]|nr:TIGR04086 family membrane protein [Oscillospiraceae bacterium]
MKDLKVDDNGFVQVVGLTTPIIKGTLIGILVGFIISLIPAVLINGALMSTSGVKFVSTVVLFITGFVSAWFSAIFYGKNGMITGIITGLVILAVIFLTGLLFQTVSFEMIDLSLFLIKLFGLMLFGAVGGIFGINIKS